MSRPILLDKQEVTGSSPVSPTQETPPPSGVFAFRGGWAGGRAPGFPGPPGGYTLRMRIGTSIFLIAVGAIMRYAVTAHTKGFSVHTAGTILMVVGIVGLVISLVWAAMAARRTRAAVVGEPVAVARDPRDPRRTY